MSANPKAPPAPTFVRSLEHLIDFVDTAAVGLHWVAADGTIVWANPADYESLGYGADEYIGHNITEFHADPNVIADILRRLSAGERLHDYEARLKCKDGSIRHVQITSSVLFEDVEDVEKGRKFVHTRCYTQDITQRKHLELARDRFVGILGHDLRNPLGAISMAAEYLRHAKDIPERHTKNLERIVNSADRMSRMIVDLIEFARALGKQMLVKRQEVDFAEVCRRIIDEVEQAYPGVHLDFDAQGDTRGQWDPDRLAQAVANLVTNAVQHGEPPFQVTVKDAGRDVVLAVSNQGAPIAPEAQGGIFEPFSHTTATQGLGLGLFIVNEIVAAHGGSIDVRTTRDDGTTFTSRWPRSAGEQA